MKLKRLLTLLLIAFFLTANLAAASLWLPFALGRKDALNWYYDRDSISYHKYMSFLGVVLPIKDRNYKTIWIRTERPGEIRFLVYLDCSSHIATVRDETGVLYDVPLIDYLYGKPIPPDSVLDKLHMAVCR